MFTFLCIVAVYVSGCATTAFVIGYFDLLKPRHTYDDDNRIGAAIFWPFVLPYLLPRTLGIRAREKQEAKVREEQRQLLELERLLK